MRTKLIFENFPSSSKIPVCDSMPTQLHNVSGLHLKTLLFTVGRYGYLITSLVNTCISNPLCLRYCTIPGQYGHPSATMQDGENLPSIDYSLIIVFTQSLSYVNQLPFILHPTRLILNFRAVRVVSSYMQVHPTSTTSATLATRPRKLKRINVDITY